MKANRNALTDQLVMLREELADGLDRLADKLRHNGGRSETAETALAVRNEPAEWAPSRLPDRPFDITWPRLFDWTWPQGETFPRVEVENNEDEVVVRAELPGMNKDDFTTEVTGNRLTIRGERRSEREEKGKNTLYRECTYGSFTRTLPLPAEVDADKAKAAYKNGVLTVKMPKTEAARARRIRVTTN